MKPVLHRIVPALALMMSSFWAHTADAVVVISDDFSQPNHDTGTHTPYNVYAVRMWDGAPGGNGLSPNAGTTPGSTVLGTNLPGGTWRFGGGANYDYDACEVGNLAGYGASNLTLTGGSAYVPYAFVRNNNCVAITTGSYNVNNTLTISVAVAPKENVAYVGYVSALNVANNFSGLKLDQSGGLTLYVSGAQVGATVAFSGGTFNSNTASLLSYNVNTTTGAISNITLQGSTANYLGLSTTGFTAAKTAYAAFYVPSGGGAMFANFQLSATSTATTYALTVTNGTGGGNYTAGTAVAVTADTPASGYQFSGWTGATSALANPSSASTTLTMPAAATAITATYSPVGGTTILSDDLSGSYISIIGTNPETNQTGATWQLASGWNYNQVLYPSSETGGLRWGAWNGSAAAINLATNGSYTKPATMTISAQVYMATASAGASPWLTLGFYDALEASSGAVLDSRTNFTGVVLNYNGSLSLYNDGVLVSGSTVNFGGTFAKDTYYTLSYSVNTTTGAISGLTLSGSSANYASLMSAGSPFTNAKTAYAGLGAASDGGSAVQGGGRFKNFNLTGSGSTPPTTYSLTVNSGTGSGNYAAGTSVPVTANTPASGFVFSAWTGATPALANPTSASTTLTMPAAATSITATYVAAPGGISPFGISQDANVNGYATWMPTLAQAGIKGFRYFPEWGGIEPVNNTYDYSFPDSFVGAATTSNMQIAGALLFSPGWAASSHHEFPMSNLTDWAEYVGNVVGRYDGSPQTAVTYWEVWNEPNSGSFNTGNRPASDYATLIRTAYTAAKAANPNCKIGITVANYDVRYIKQVLDSLAAQGAAGSFDFIAVHPYELVARMNAADGEIQYLNIVPALRQLLNAQIPSKANVPIRFTELGSRIGDNLEGQICDAPLAARLMVKAYVLGIVQGAEQINWFEGKDPTSDTGSGEYGFGILDVNQNKRQAWYAYKAMTDSLGSTPLYKGWLVLGSSSSGYGLVFGGATSDVMAAWMPRGETATITFSSAVEIVDIYTNTITTGTSVNLTEKPVLIRNLPSALVTQAVSNKTLPYPWASAPVNSNLAQIQFGAVTLSSGIDLDQPQTVTPNGSGTNGVFVNQVGSGLYLALNTAFASYNTSDVYVRVTARQTSLRTGSQYCGMNLFYQSNGGSATAAPQYPYQGESVGGWFGLANNTTSQTKVWHLTSAMFTHTFGYGIYFQFDGSVPFVMEKVEVSKVAF